MTEIITKNLLLVPCSLDIAKSLIFHRKELDKKSPIIIPTEWPSLFMKGILPYYIENLEKDNKLTGWGIWLIISHEDKKLIGDLCLNGKPDVNGRVSFIYHKVLNQYESLSFEAINAIIDWLQLNKAVKHICLECGSHQDYTIKLYEKLGFICKSKDKELLTWEMSTKN